MKRCPRCEHTYSDDTIKFCRYDGTPLVAEVSSESSATIILPTAPRSAETPTQPLLNTPSIAVLPFANISADAENEYFCDGLAEELLNALVKIENLKVAARTSAFSFKGKNTNVAEVGRALNVNTVLEGSVRKSGNRVRITVQLVSASDGYHLWSERYDREMKDIFDVQEEITLAVVGALKVKLLGKEKAAVLKRYTDNIEAYQLYLRGNYHLYKFTPDNLQQAIRYFDGAIAQDPDYALAYTGLAAAYGIGTDFGVESGAAQMEANARKAITLDPTLAEAHAMLAAFSFWNKQEVAQAQDEFMRALKLNPNSVIVRHYYSWFLIAMARFEEAQEHLRRALELDPLSPSINVDQGLPLYFSRRYAEARVCCERALKLDANFGYAHVRLAEACEGVGDAACAISEFERALAIVYDNTVKVQLARALASAGRKEDARRLLEELTTPEAALSTSPYYVALAYAAISESDKAFDKLERALAERDKWIGWMKVDPRLDSLRSDPRFQDLLRRMRFAP